MRLVGQAVPDGSSIRHSLFEKTFTTFDPK